MTRRTSPRLLLAVLIGRVVIVVTGGVVRLSGSGLGCPTWPRCTARELAPVLGAGRTAWIEFANRILVAGATVLYLSSGDHAHGAAVLPNGWPRRMGWTLVVVVAATVIVGTVAVGSGRHAGDADAAARFPFDHRIVGALHAGLAVAMLTAIVMLRTVVQQVPESAGVQRLTRSLLLTVLVTALTLALTGHGGSVRSTERVATAATPPTPAEGGS